MRPLTFALVMVTAATAAQPKLRLYSEVPAIQKGQKLLWRNPGAVERKSLRYGEGGRELAPLPPFTFIEKDGSGTSPKVLVRDRAGRKWSVKFGEEVSADVFGSHLAWALGYYSEPTYYVARGTIQKIGAVQDLGKCVDGAGRFQHARFQLRSKYPEYLTGVSWSWKENPFLGTRELSGLKILLMLLSNWDDKDIRDERIGSNAAIYRAGSRYLFFVNDWGASMGDWGWGPTRLMLHLTHSKWDCRDYSKQSSKLVEIKDDGELDWGYRGAHKESMTAGVSRSDMRWFMRYLGRLSSQQIHAGLLASGASASEAACFTETLMVRIRKLAAVAGSVRPLVAKHRQRRYPG